MKPEELSKYRQVASHVVSAAMWDGHSKTLSLPLGTRLAISKGDGSAAGQS